MWWWCWYYIPPYHHLIFTILPTNSLFQFKYCNVLVVEVRIQDDDNFILSVFFLSMFFNTNLVLGVNTSELLNAFLVWHYMFDFFCELHFISFSTKNLRMILWFFLIIQFRLFDFHLRWGMWAVFAIKVGFIIKTNLFAIRKFNRILVKQNSILNHNFYYGFSE